MKVYIVFQDNCNEGDCDCLLESLDSVWEDEKKAKTRAAQTYNGRVECQEVKD